VDGILIPVNNSSKSTIKQNIQTSAKNQKAFKRSKISISPLKMRYLNVLYSNQNMLAMLRLSKTTSHQKLPKNISKNSIKI
jgi:hypothetical protein